MALAQTSSSGAPGSPSDPGATVRPPRLITRPFLTVTAATLAYFISIGISLPAIPRYITDGLGQSGFVVGAAVTAYSLAAVGARPLISWTARRFGERWMMVAGSLLGAAAIVLVPVVTPTARVSVPIVCV